MKALEKLKIEHPEEFDVNGNRVHPDYCPSWYGYTEPGDCMGSGKCDECWNREIPDEHGLIKDDLVPVVNQALYGEEKHVIKHARGVIQTGPHDKPFENPTIKDSGTRREFGTGAVRDIQEGKGRCDLLPLDIIGEYGKYSCELDEYKNEVFIDINTFKETGRETFLFNALNHAALFDYPSTMFLEVAKHFEEGAKKYSENNWKKGIPTHCYIDSAVRHYLKYLRGDTDEPHDRAFVWNILCCIWTCKHKPELNDYAACEDSPVKKVIVKTETGPHKMDIFDQPVEEAK